VRAAHVLLVGGDLPYIVEKSVACELYY